MENKPFERIQRSFNYTPASIFTNQWSNLAFGVGMIVIPALFPFGLRIRHLRILSPAVFSTILIVGGVLLLFFTWRSMRNARALKAAGGKITVDGTRVTYPEVEKGKIEYRSFLTTDIEYVKDDEEEHQCKVKTPDNYIIFETRYFDSEEEFEAFRDNKLYKHTDMITRLMKIAVAIVVAALSLTACGSGETFPMASEEGLSKIRELVAEHVDTSKYKIYEVEWREDNRDRQLENILTSIDVYYIDADNNNYHLAFQLTNGKFTTDGPEQNDRQTNSYACSTPLDLAAIDFDYLQKIGEKADALVMSDEEGKKLTLKSAGMFRFRVWPVSLSNVDRWNRSEEYRAESKQMQVQFELNYVDESESPEYQGRFTVTNYYTVAFTADAAGEVAIDD